MSKEAIPKKTYAQTLTQREYVEGMESEGEKEARKENAGDEKNPDRDYTVEFDSKGHANIIISKDEKERLAPWKKTLIVKLLGKKVGYSILRKKIESA